VRVSIDRFGRVVVPKEMRDRHGIVPGSDLEILDAGETIVLRRLSDLPGLVEKDGILVFRSRATGDVESAVQEHRARRLSRQREVSG
jgi:AbrB family looped-hinge helix DNA binding protein